MQHLQVPTASAASPHQPQVQQPCKEVRGSLHPEGGGAAPIQRDGGTHLSTRRPHRRHAGSRAALGPGSAREHPLSQRSPQHPATASQCQAQSARSREPPGPFRSPAGGRRRWHPAGSRCPGRWCPRCPRCTPPPCQHSARGRPPASAACFLRWRVGFGLEMRMASCCLWPLPVHSPEHAMANSLGFLLGSVAIRVALHCARISSVPTQCSSCSSMGPEPLAGTAWIFSGTPQPSCRHTTVAVPLSHSPTDTRAQTPGRTATSSRPSQRLSPPCSRRGSATPATAWLCRGLGQCSPPAGGPHGPHTHLSS